MTEQKIYEIINEIYDYEIIDEDTLEKLRTSRDVILSEFGIESIYEFLSYNITEFSDARKSIHVRRFYQYFKTIFRLESFTIEAFHKIQAGCLYSAITSGIVRGYGSYDYTGFVNEVLLRVRSGGTGNAGMTPLDMLGEISSQFKLFSRISLGTYSLQIFTKYGISMEKLNLGAFEKSRKLFMKALKKIEEEQDASNDINKILNIKMPSEEKINEAIEDYIDYAVNGVMEDGIPINRSKETKKLMDSVDEVKAQAEKAFTSLKIDLEAIRRYKETLKIKFNVYNRSKDNNDVSILYISMLEKFILDLSKLSYYEDIFFIKRLNAMFVNMVKEIFDAQMAEERNIIREKCIKLIETNLPGYNVYELDGVLSALSMHKSEFSEQFSVSKSDINNTISELKTYLRQQLESVYDIRRNLKNSLSSILGSEIVHEKSADVLENAINNFSDIRDFLLEEE